MDKTNGAAPSRLAEIFPFFYYRDSAEVDPEHQQLQESGFHRVTNAENTDQKIAENKDWVRGIHGQNIDLVVHRNAYDCYGHSLGRDFVSIWFKKPAT